MKLRTRLQAKLDTMPGSLVPWQITKIKMSFLLLLRGMVRLNLPFYGRGVKSFSILFLSAQQLTKLMKEEQRKCLGKVKPGFYIRMPMCIC